MLYIIARDKGHKLLGFIALGTGFISEIVNVISFFSEEDKKGKIMLLVSLILGIINLVLFVIIICNKDYANKSGYKSRKADTLLCFFLGFLGVHRFYEGKIVSGIFELLTLGYFGIGWMVDFFIILVGKSTDRNGNLIERWN